MKGKKGKKGRREAGLEHEDAESPHTALRPEIPAACSQLFVLVSP